jgi:signal transduction histidine kinase
VLVAGKFVEQSKILIVSDDPEFVNLLVRGWQRLEYSPEFTVCKRGSAEPAGGAVMVADGLEALAGMQGEVLQAIVVTSCDEPLPEAGFLGRPVVRIRRSEGWAEYAAALVQETMLRMEALRQVVETEGRLRELEHFAALGRFISEARHGLGNALTSVMGNSELLLLDPRWERCSDVRGQLETIHAMSLRMLMTLQDLSSLEVEMRKKRGAPC